MTSTLPRSEEELALAIKGSKKLANRKALYSAAGGALPIPGVDVLIDLALIQQVTEQINRCFGLSKEQIEELDAGTKLKIADVLLKLGEKGITTMVGKRATKELVKQMLLRMGSKSAGKSAAKLVPIIGSVVSAGLSYGIMRVMCELHIRDCNRVVQTAWGKKTDWDNDEVIELESVPPPLPDSHQSS